METLIQSLWENAIKRPNTFPEITVWLERAEAEHVKRPFHAIIATSNPRKNQDVIDADILIEEGHDKWQIPDFPPTRRNAADIAKAVLPLFRCCRHAILIDPYFNPKASRFREPFESILLGCQENIYGPQNMQIELHISIERFFYSFDSGENRTLAHEQKVCKNLTSDLNKYLPPLIPAGMKVKITIWKQIANGEKLHNRYFLTNMFGLIFPTGADASENPETVESDDIVLLENGQYNIRYQQYAGSNPPFARATDQFFITGTKVWPRNLFSNPV